MKQIVIIYGPTAVGKSGVAVELAKMIDGEIISADSMQIYKTLDIGSAKISREEMQGITHHLIDILEPDQEYNASNFCDDCIKIIDEIIERGKTPIIVGGTGLYINGLINGYNFGEAEKNQLFRDELNNLSCEEIYKRIVEIDPCVNIDRNNKRRLIRALEKLTFGGDVQNKCNLKYPYKLFAICDDRQTIYERINSRVDKMIDLGLLDEAKSLLNLNLCDESLCMKAIGYKELFPYLKGEDSLDNCVNILNQKTRNYAKRQFTFMNQFKDLIKVDFCGIKETAKKINDML